MRQQGVSIWAMDKAYYRFERRSNGWALIAEVHAITDRSNADHYLWQFEYAPDSRGSSLRYKLREVSGPS
jgi:hypothetical protein